MSEDEIKSSNLVGISLAVGIIGAAMYIINNDLLFAMIGFFGITMMIPLASVFSPVKMKSKNILVAYTILLAFFGFGSILSQAVNGEAGTIPMVYIFGIIAYGWVANAFIIK